MTTASIAKALGFTGIAADLIEATRKGLPAKSADRLAQLGGLSNEQLAAALGVSTRTLARQRGKAKLGPVESDRAVRLARVLGLALEVFEDRNRSIAWLHDPIVALDGKAPVNFLDTDAGVRRIEQILTRLDYGGIS
jgi:putative toxin-antitoxin system antitoxin component (TIGR02293 family)